MNDPNLARRHLLKASMLVGVAQTATTLSSQAPQPTVFAPRDPAVHPDGRVSVTDFLSPEQWAQVRAGRPTDCTLAFTDAQRAAPVIWVPPGRYGLTNLRLRDGVSLLGAGSNVVRIDQAAADQPAIACLSDEASGQLSAIVVNGMTIHGHPQASVTAVLVAAYKQYAIWRSKFEYVARNTFRALEIQGADAANVFHCHFHVTSEGTRDTAVVVNGGTYNTLAIFATQCRTWAIDDSSANSEIRAIGENCMIFRGQNNRIRPTLEEIPYTPASDTGIEDKGFGNTFETPTIIMSQLNKLKYGFKPFSNSVFINPQIIGLKDAVIHPFALGIAESLTIIGGRSQARHPIEETYNGTSDRSARELVTMIGGSTGLARSGG